MATVISKLPLFSDPITSYSVDVEGVNRTIVFKWNNRTSNWHFDLINDDGTVVVEGIKLVPNYPMLVDYQLEEKDLTGYFCLVDAGSFPSNKLNVGPESLPQWYELYYVYFTEE